MTDQDTRPSSLTRVLALLGFGVAVAGMLHAGGTGRAVAPQAKEPPSVGGVPIFSTWPKNAKPDAVIVLSGQSFGYLQPCGCSRPQFGGLERRAVFLAGLKAQGWPVAAVDLGDVLPARGIVNDQVMLKYKTMMNALREMGYVAVGVGKAELDNGLFQILGQYALQRPDPPFILAGNLTGLQGKNQVPRAEAFPAVAPGATRPMVGLAEVASVGNVPVGIVGVVGPSVALAVGNKVTDVGFTSIKKNPKDKVEDELLNGVKDTIAAGLKELQANPKKPAVNILLFQGTEAEAKAVARPEFQVVLCQSDDLAPALPVMVNHANGQKTMIVMVGQKGQNVGAVGVYRKPDGTFDLHYQLVPLDESFITPGPEAVAQKTNPMLPILEEYAKEVKARNFLGKFPEGPHPAMIQQKGANLAFVGSAACQACHAAEFAKWKEVPPDGHAHSIAYDKLEHVAKRPGLRNFDGECAVCHTVGLGYKTGFRDKQTTPALIHVGCESCHGPGSGHVAAPNNKELLKLMSPWKSAPADKLPDTATMNKIAALNPAERGKVPLPASQTLLINNVSRACMGCHDSENDPHFDLYKYWPKIAHSGMAPPGGWPAVPPPKK